MPSSMMSIIYQKNCKKHKITEMNRIIKESKNDNVNITIKFGGYYSEKSKKFDGGIYPILQYLKDNKLKNIIVKLDPDFYWDEVDLFCEELYIKELDYTPNNDDSKYGHVAKVICNPMSAKYLIKMLIHMASLGNGGHSYPIFIDKKRFSFDGDGADHIISINDVKLNSDVYNNTNKQADIYKKGTQENKNLNENKMKTVRLTENQLHSIIKDSVNSIIKEATNSQIKKKVINQIYKHTQSLTSRIYKDDNWENVRNVFGVIESVIGDSGELDIRVENGGYWKLIGEFPNYKEYKFTITLNNGIKIEGSLKCHAAGTMEDTFSRYDITITMW